MSDFSDKYKNALEKLEISPDFKERTEKMMIGLRDAPKPQTKKITMYRKLSVIAAAAACIAVGFSLNRAGVFDNDSSPAVIETDVIAGRNVPTEDTASTEAAISAVTEQSLPDKTAGDDEEGIISARLIEHDEPAVIYETALPVPQEFVTEPSQASPKEDISPETTAVSQITLPTAALPETIQSIGNAAEAPESVIITEPKYETAYTDSEHTADEQLALEEAEYIPPSESENTVEDDAMYYEEAGGGATESDSDEAPNVSYSGSAEDFSAQKLIKSFKASESYAVITPLTSDYIDSSESLVTNSPKKLRSIKDITALETNICTTTEGHTATALSSAPSDSLYIIDLADKQGKALRIYIGSRYICFSLSDGSIYSFELSEEDFSAIDGLIAELIS